MEETIKSFKSLMYNAKANWDYFSYEILFNFFSLYNNAIEENKKLNEYKENYISKQKVENKIEELNRKIDKSIDNSKGALDEEFIEKAGELLAQKRILQELLEEGVIDK